MPRRRPGLNFEHVDEMWPTVHLPIRYYPAFLALVTLVPLVVFFARVPPAQLGYDMLHTSPAQVLTYMAAHSDAAHLSSNVVSQVALGAFVECMHGHARFLVIYVGTGVGGALTYRGSWCAFYAPRNVYLVGASGAVYGLLGAYTAHILINWSQLRLRALWVGAVLLTLILDVAAYVYSPQPGVAYAAHVGGAAYGVCLGVLVLRNARIIACERALSALAGLALGSMVVSVPLLCGSCQT